MTGVIYFNTNKIIKQGGSKMKNIYLIVGPSGVGKTTVANELARLYGYKVVQSYTTRPPRYENEPGHIFVNEEEFNALGELCAYTEYNGCKYGVPQTMVDECDLYIIDPPGVEYLREHYHGGKKIVVIGLYAEVDKLRHRMKKRGDSNEEIEARLKNDRVVFGINGLGHYALCNICVKATNLIATVRYLKEYIEYCKKYDFYIS
jgi:guanylate kinase